MFADHLLSMNVVSPIFLLIAIVSLHPSLVCSYAAHKERQRNAKSDEKLEINSFCTRFNADVSSKSMCSVCTLTILFRFFCVIAHAHTVAYHFSCSVRINFDEGDGESRNCSQCVFEHLMGTRHIVLCSRVQVIHSLFSFLSHSLSSWSPIKMRNLFCTENHFEHN